MRKGSLMANDPHDWMWSEALSMLAKAERMHQQLFQPGPGRAQASWEPPVDVLETEREVLVLAALPGVDVAQVQATIEGGVLVVSGHRAVPPELRTAVIHRLELPQGRFERRVPLPPGRYSDVRRSEAHGCLVISLSKAQ
jgi:HSP20 family molecular chaperone IbpA